MKDAVLAVIDVQKRWVNDNTQRVVSEMDSLQSHYRRVCAFRLSTPPGKMRSSHTLVPGDEGFELAFDRHPGAIPYNRTRLSCLTHEFSDDLVEWGCNEVHLAGIGSESSILFSAIDLLDHGINPVVLAYYCASPDGGAWHESALRLLIKLLGPHRVRLSPVKVDACV